MATAQDLSARAEQLLKAIPHQYRGPGGSAAILKDGEVVSKLCWGYASLERRAPMQASTLLPICSISKQMVCLAMVSLMQRPTQSMRDTGQDASELFNAELKRLLPHLSHRQDLTLDTLYNMQSGIRDYWVMTTLYGADPEGAFSITEDAPRALERTKTLHFDPGTEFSYSNVNFYVLGRILENVSGQSLSQLLAERVFIPAGMSTASLYINTQGIALPIVGYEGDEKVGFFAATNRIEWAGDAGISASLDDMIAYEKYLERTYSDPSSLYHHTSREPKFRDGKPAEYGFGLMRGVVAGKTTIRHGGALRGFRLQRVHLPTEHMSVLVMLNHDADAGAAADGVIKQLFDHQDPKADSTLIAAPEWNGVFLDEGSQLRIAVKTSVEKPGQVDIHYARPNETFNLTPEAEAVAAHGAANIDGDVLHLRRSDDNRVIRANRIAKPSEQDIVNVKGSDYVGVYRCDEADSTFHCTGEHGTLYGSFDGYLGKGPVWLMKYVGEDVWILGNPRGMDAQPPGDWTLVFRRGKDGKVDRLTMGCFLARHNEFYRQS